MIITHFLYLPGINLRHNVERVVEESGVPRDSSLFGLSTKMAQYLVHSRSDNTAKSYFYSFRRFENFIRNHGHSALPAQPIHVCLYLTHLLDTGATYHSINSCIYSIKWIHEINNFLDPTNNSFVTSLQESARRISRPKVSRKDPVTVEILIKLCEQFKDCSDLFVLRDLTMILISFAGFLRYDELSSLKCCDVIVMPDHLIVKIIKSKTDQYRNGSEVLISKGDTLACPYDMFLRYVNVSNIDLSSDFFIFRPVFRSKNVCKLIYKNKKLSYTRARETIISRLKSVSENLDFGLHSMRSGGATVAANSFVNDRCLKRHGRWKCDSSKDRYIVDSLDNRLSVSRSLNL